jgi:hypothetical protein
VAEAQAATGLVVGGQIRIKERGNAVFDIATGLTDNGYDILSLANSLFAKLVVNGSANVRWFGAKGDGSTDDTASIQAALNSYYSVFIPIGNFLISSITVPDGVELRGSGHSSVLLISTSSTAVSAGNNTLLRDIAILPSTTDTTFTHPNDGLTDADKDFQYKDNAIGVGAEAKKNIKLVNVYIERLWRGTSFSGCSDITTTHCTLFQIGEWHTQFYNCNKVIFSNNICLYGGGSGGVAASSVKNAIFSNNYVLGSGTGINTGGADIAGYNVENIVVSGNNVLARDCINLENGVENASITGNVCVVLRNLDLPGVTGVGIACMSSSGGTAGGKVSNIAVESNVVKTLNNQVAFGVSVGTDATNYNYDIENICISNNTVTNANYSIRVVSLTTGKLVKDVVVSGNIGKLATKGIVTSNVENLIISDNILSQGSSSPLSGYQGLYINITNIAKIYNNILAGFGDGAVFDSASSKIYLKGNSFEAHYLSGTYGNKSTFSNTAYNYWNGDGSANVTLADSRLYCPSNFVYYTPSTTHTVFGLIGGYLQGGEVVTVEFNGNTTLQNSASLSLKNGVTTTPPDGKRITFAVVDSNKLIEISRDY